MLSFSRVTSVIAIIFATSVFAGVGCNAIFDINERGFGGAGGASSGNPVSTGSGAIGGSGGMGSSGMPKYLCEYGAPALTDCDQSCDNANPPPDSRCHCGACNHDCGGAKCMNATCQVVESVNVEGFIYAVATNGRAVFFASSVDPGGTMPRTTVYKIPFDKGQSVSPVELSTFDGVVRHIAAGCNRVYFAIMVEPGASSPVTPRIAAVDANTIVPMTPVDIMPAVDVAAMAAEGDLLVWADNAGSNAGVSAFRGAGPRELIAQKPGQPLTDVAIHDNHVYWAAGDLAGMGIISRALIPPGGNDPWIEEAVRNAEHPAGWPISIAVNRDSVYWYDLFGPARLRKAPDNDPGNPGIELGQVATTATGTVSSPWLGVDDNYLYAVEIRSGVGRIVRVSINGGMVLPVAASDFNSTVPFSAQALAMDARRVYFTGTSTSTSQILWVAK